MICMLYSMLLTYDALHDDANIKTNNTNIDEERGMTLLSYVTNIYVAMG